MQKDFPHRPCLLFLFLQAATQGGFTFPDFLLFPNKPVFLFLALFHLDDVNRLPLTEKDLDCFLLCPLLPSEILTQSLINTATDPWPHCVCMHDWALCVQQLHSHTACACMTGPCVCHSYIAILCVHAWVCTKCATVTQTGGVFMHEWAICKHLTLIHIS